MRTNPVISFCVPPWCLCSAVNPHILHPDPDPLCRGTRWTADRGPNIPERLCFRAAAALWDLLSWPLERDNSVQRRRGESGSALRCRRRRCAQWTECAVRVRAANAHRQARSPTVDIKLKRQVLPKLYARQAVGAYHSKALPIKCQSR